MLLRTSALFSQEVSATFHFEEDSVDLGRPVKGVLEISHPSATVVIFPDSAIDFAPWEIASSIPHPTVTKSGISVDRKTYFIRNFEIDSVQTLRLPYRYLIGNDTVLQYSGYDTLLFRTRIPEWNDSLKLKYFEGLTAIADPPNYALILVIWVATMLLLALLFILLRKPFLSWLKTRKIDKEWREVTNRLRNSGHLIPQQQAFINEVNYIWKKYLDPSRQFSLSSLTTPELRETLPKLEQLDESDRRSLLEISQTADMIQFAGMRAGEDSLKALPDRLLSLLEKEFKRRKGEMQG